MSSTKVWGWSGVVLMAVLTSAGCSGLGVAPGKIACGTKDECPSPFVCGEGHLCWEKGHRLKDAAVDLATEGGSPDVGVPDTAVDVPVNPEPDAGATDAACPANQHLCPVGCVTNNSPQTCGTSCTPCLDPANGGTATCDGTKCDGTCPNGKKLCLGACIDNAALCGSTCTVAGTHLCGQSCPNVLDVNACGKSCDPCPVPANSVGANCDGTTCGFTCKTSFHPCGTSCAADSDANACGTACVACPSDPNGTPVCAGGSCGLQCKSGFHLCGTKCVSNSDVGSCGASSCTACPAIAGGTATCDGTKCGATCAGTQVVCNGACVAGNAACGPCPTGTHNCGGTCVSNKDTNTCGASCSACVKPTGATQTTCDGTTCDFTCGASYHRCGASCAANDDATACGASCTKCPTDPNGVASCQSNGTCALSCNTGYHPCGSACVSNKDVNNCGATVCNSPCKAPAGGTVSCDGVSCLPVCTNPNQYNCQGTCIDKAMACAGMCQVAGQHVCSGFCHANDVSSCGPTCQTCPGPPANGSPSCDGTSCSISCSAGFRNCPGTNLCISSALPACCVSSDCAAGKPICSNGTCVGRTNGSLCGGGTECASGNCVDGVCCDIACAGQCQACDINGSLGTCKTVTSGPPHRAATPVRALCGGDPACGGTCNGVSPTKCTYPANQCRGQSCSNNIQVNAAVCDANGVCPAAATVACAPAPCGLGCVNGACQNVTAASRTQCGTFADTTQQYDEYPNTVYLLCDGQGGCKGPTFNCGTGGPCTLSASITCCNLTFQTQITSCTNTMTMSCYSGGPNDEHEKCKDTLDCPSSLVCCKAESYGYRGLFCAASCADSNAFPVCDPNRGGTCPTGQTCHDDGNNIGEGTCG
ncbi:MAG: Flagellar hook-length control protein FliK [Myxococcales bacterium]|nr:Flagellar hook-length control protein FliK [Myxococcales bacterium]